MKTQMLLQFTCYSMSKKKRSFYLCVSSTKTMQSVNFKKQLGAWRDFDEQHACISATATTTTNSSRACDLDIFNLVT